MTGVDTVKICGLTRPDNALDCARAGADMIGMVFFEKSPRNVTLDQAREICRALPDHVTACGVFVDEPFARIMAIAQECGLGGVQLHGGEPPALVERLSAEGLVVIKAFFAARRPDLSMAEHYGAADFCLAEYGKGDLPGGNAESWNYGLAAGVNQSLMLAGGLTPENVGTAIIQASPDAVDASSGVESAPGIKDINRVTAFVSAAKHPQDTG